MNAIKHAVAALIAGAALFTLPISAAEPPADLNTLLSQLKSESAAESKLNAEREARFLADKNQQAALLAKAKAELSAELARGEKLKASFDANDKQLTELTETLRQRSGNMGEMFGVLRQFAGEFRGIFNNSALRLQYPEQGKLLAKLADSKELPSSDELAQFWTTLLSRMVDAGKVTQFPATVVYGEGNQGEHTVTQISEFNTLADGKYLSFIPETGKFEQLPRQPDSAILQPVSDFEQADGSVKPIYIDPSRGVILSLLVQTPNLKERLDQGGEVGYVIMALGLLGLLLALFCGARLSLLGRAMRKQLKSDSAIKGNPIGEMLEAYQAHRGDNIEDLESKFDEIILKQVPKLEKGLSVLKLIASVAPLLGLLGTVVGMIATFQAITLFGTGDPKLMAGGISEALVTTMQGLVVAVPILFLYTMVQTQSRRLIQLLEEQSAGYVARYQERQHAKAA
ncbi:MotA/TolQ/ExbB proton channel family protein [Aeromonas simiae]|uniref:MotA/TolQ/ExbB proton channel family protein n=1 Tax=Aeromonas simiae TaxID=218936 RepID=UPI00266C74F2|nr:MotA/TolQ/ExbB proton channel family protein [Aeromonas simiae]MDO2948112.1 MotA/TolQ/ExbB proton channel family protein [Aeromonas simiae]MDO2952852.1 MotA/TolQ/ExbB proton channel family protein [Aeromonas simiae]MDO2955469.1 MotA/TolQ/ExbB proton channel family protein [Aeromonas simiae]